VCRIADPSFEPATMEARNGKSATMAAFDDGIVLVDHAAIAAFNEGIVPISGNNMKPTACSVWASCPSEQRGNGQALRGDSGCGAD
jgi:hypothetical protein